MPSSVFNLYPLNLFSKINTCPTGKELFFIVLFSIQGEVTGMKKKLLFVTYLDEYPGEGISYVIELATAINEDLTIFFIRKRSFCEKIDDLMTSATFAAFNEYEAGQVIAGLERVDGSADKRLTGLLGKCRASGINIDVVSSMSDTVPAIVQYFRQTNGVDMVLIGPNITDHSNVTQRKLRKLSHIVARPVVAIARQASVPAVVTRKKQICLSSPA
jgi:hypothetical protein